jgi:hypothetical protein
MLGSEVSLIHITNHLHGALLILSGKVKYLMLDYFRQLVIQMNYVWGGK